MAIWQYNFHIIPKAVILSKIDHLDKKDDLFDDEPFWESNPMNINIFKEIEEILPKSDSWSNRLILYGSLESNCLEVYFLDEAVISVSFRIDFRSDYEELLDRMLEFFFLKELLMVGENLKILFYDKLEIINLISNSPQFFRYQQLLK